MDETYENYLRTRLAGLQAEAASVQQALDMYLDFKAKTARGASGATGANGQATEPASKPTPQTLNKTAFVLSLIRDCSPLPRSPETLWDDVVRAKIDMTKDHLRSILWHGVKDCKIERNPDGTYIAAKKEPVASTTGSIFDDSRG